MGKVLREKREIERARTGSGKLWKSFFHLSLRSVVYITRGLFMNNNEASRIDEQRFTWLELSAYVRRI